ncbi:hypothetical protein BJX99DRAFT_103974 [Aspergillus californicus]
MVLVCWAMTLLKLSIRLPIIWFVILLPSSKEGNSTTGVCIASVWVFLPRRGIVGIASCRAEFSGVCGAIGPSRLAHNHNHGFDIQQFGFNSVVKLSDFPRFLSLPY